MALGKKVRMALLVALACGLGAVSAAAQESEQPPPGAPSAPLPVLRVGDCWQYRNFNVRKGEAETIRCVMKVVNDGYVMETAGRIIGLARYDRNLVWLGSIGADRTIRQPARSQPPLRLKFPLWVGKRWSDSYRALDEKLGGFFRFANVYLVETLEKVTVPAGTFVAFRVRRQRKNLKNLGGLLGMSTSGARIHGSG